jgi:fumarate hydratase subunit beta
MDAPRTLSLPMSREEASELKLGDMVMLEGPIVMTAGLPTHRRILDCIRSGEALPVELKHSAFFHLGSYSREDGDGFEVLYMNPTTSTRFNDMMPEIIRHFGLRCVGGKGGLDAACADALREVGGVYLSFLGGGAPLHSASIERILKVGWQDLTSHYRLVSMEVRGLGPLAVAIDAHGNNLYDKLSEQAQNRRAGILQSLRAARG